MNWIRAHYDRIALLSAGPFLLLCFVSAWRKNAQFQTEIASQIAPPPQNTSAPAKATEIEAARQKLNHPRQWTFSSRSGLFVPEKHFVGANDLPATLETTEIHPPVPNEWFEQFNLPITEGNVLDQDPDDDGFTNLDEWQNHSDPIERNSHPDYLTKLKLKSATEEPFRLIFSSWAGGSYAINTIDLKQPTQFLKIGDTVRGTRFKIVKLMEKYQSDKYGTEIDCSELTLEHEETKQQLTLVKEKVATSPESVATFIYSWSERREFQVRKDQEFSLNPEEQIKYKLIDVKPDKAVIVNTQKPGEPIEIGSLIP